MLGKRLLTALVAIPAIILLIFKGGHLGFSLFIFCAVGVAVYEYLTFLYPEKINVQIVTHVLLGLTLPAAFYFGFPELIVPTLSFVLIFTMAFSLFRVTDPQSKARNLFVRVFGILYIAFLLSFLIPMHTLPHGSWWVLLAVGINFGTDAGGYFAGRFLGKHKLYPVVSPKKTVEGSLGGILAGCLVVLIFKYIHFDMFRYLDVIVLGVAGAVLAILGDMVESLIKRGFDVKDAGGILPGHGGIMDRIDSFVFSLPFIYYYALFISNL